MEKRDLFKASSVNLKFVAFRTPKEKELTRTMHLPSRLYFTLKFYLFPQAKTERLILRLPKTVAKDLDEQAELHRKAAAKRRRGGKPGMDVGEGLLLGRQYFLMKYKHEVDYKAELAKLRDGERARASLEADYVGLENGHECNFDFDPQAFVP